jgi:hypothetical protein
MPLPCCLPHPRVVACRSPVKACRSCVLVSLALAGALACTVLILLFAAAASRCLPETACAYRSTECQHACFLLNGSAVAWAQFWSLSCPLCLVTALESFHWSFEVLPEEDTL